MRLPFAPRALCRFFSLPTLLCSILLLFAFSAHGQSTPSLQGTSIADTAVPVVITPAPQGSGFFVLNQDYSLLQHSTADSSRNQSCTPPTVFSKTSAAPRTLVSDLYNAYLSGPDSSGSSTAVTAVTPEQLCAMTTPFDSTGGLASQSLAANDIQHANYYLVSGYGGTQADTLTVLNNLNQATVSSSNMFSEQTQVPLDANGQYTSVVADTRSDFGLAAITELRTPTSPGNLWVYYPQTKKVYKILGPGGVPLPAIASFIIPPPTDGGGSLLVLVNQDGLDSGAATPPQVTAPFTIIDLGQLRPILALNPPGNTVTLPYVTQINATTSFYAMLGAVYDPIALRFYALVAGGTSESDYFVKVISYNSLDPTFPDERVVADVTQIPFASEVLPQLALNAASGTLQILTTNPNAVYSVGITGTANIPVAVTGSTFQDPNLQPTYIAANPLQGETYIASASGNVDILTRPAAEKGGLTLTLTGSDLGYTSQEYEVKPLALWPVYDSSLASTKLTITATPIGGQPVTIATDTVADVGYPGSSFFTYMFPAPGTYTLVANADASALYPAVKSPPIYVYVGGTGVYPTAVTLSVPATSTSSNGEANFNATVTLTGGTYGPTGQVYITDQTGVGVADIQLPDGVLTNPLTLPVTIGTGVSTLTATYSGDEQNKSSQSAPQTVTVSAGTTVSPVLHLFVPTKTVTAGAQVTGTLKTTSSITTPPTGTITIYAAPSGSTTSVAQTTVSAATSFTSGGAPFSFTAGTANTYSLFAGYGGDANYSNVVSGSTTLTVTGAALQTTVVGLVAPTTAQAGSAFNLVVGFNVEGAFTTQPTGNIVVTATTAGGAAINLGMVTPAQGMAPGGGNLSVTLPSAGTYTITATYAGDSLYAASSNMASVVVANTATTVKIAAASDEKAGKSFTATVTLTSGSTTGTPTGNVVITAVPATGATINVATVTAAQAFAAGGVAVPVTLAKGTYTLTANYAGEGTFAAASGTTLITVTTVDTAIKINFAPAPNGANSGFKSTIFLTASGSTTPPTGNITVTLTLGTGAPATQDPVSAATAFSSAGALDFSPVTVVAGTYTVTASYPGDTVYSASTGSATYAVALIPTMLAITGPSTGTAGGTLNFNVSLTPSAAVEGGDVVLQSKVNGAAGPSVSIAASLVSGAGGSSVPLTFSGAGTYSVTATYAGDAAYAASTSNAVSVTVAGTNGPASYTFEKDSLDDVNISDSKTTPGIAAVTLTSINGFSSPVTFSFTHSDSGSKIIVKAVDHVTGADATTTTPTATGRQIDLVFEYSDQTYAHNGAPAARQVVYWSGGLGLFALFTAGKRRKRLAVRLLMVCLVAGLAVVVPGCAHEQDDNFVIKVTPSDKTIPAQTQMIIVRYDSNY